MARCEVCGNDYDKSFELAPVCRHCGCRIVGHGVEAEGAFYCGAHCAAAAGEVGAVDRLG